MKTVIRTTQYARLTAETSVKAGRTTKIALFVIIGLFVFFAPNIAQAADYYVADPKGIDGIAGTADDVDSSDTYAGTEAQPFATLNKSAAVAVAGDTVFIRGGTYTEILWPRSSGTAENPITFKAYPTETPIIKRGPGLAEGDLTEDEIAAGEAGNKYGIYVYGRSYLVFQGLSITDVMGWARVLYSDHIIIRDCNLTNATTSGVKGGLRFLHCDDNIILDNAIDGGNDDITLSHSDRNLVQGNTVTSGRHAIFGIRAGNFNVIRDNYFYNELEKIGEVFDSSSAAVSPPIQYDCTKHNLIEQNTFAYSRAGAAAYSGIQYAGQSGIIRKNVFHDCQGIGIRMVTYAEEAKYNTHNRIYDNVFYNNLGGGVETGMVSDTLFLLDNIIKNNIFYKNQSMSRTWIGGLGHGGSQITSSRQSGYLFDNNNILGTVPGETDVVYTWTTPGQRSLASAEAGWPLLYANNLEVDPEFVDADNHDFHLDTGSPMIDTGAFLTKTVGTVEGESGMVLPVADARYFFDGYDMTDENGLPIPGDLIQLEGDTKTARVIDIDYVNNTLTLDKPLIWTDGQGVSLAYNGSAPDMGAYEYTPPSGGILYGDVNGIGGVDANDASLTAMATVGLITLNDEQLKKADVNNNKQPDANDASLIAQRAVGLIDKFPVEG